MIRFMKPVLTLAAFVALLATVAGAAYADCAPVIAAFLPKGDPFMVATGDVEYRGCWVYGSSVVPPAAGAGK